MEAVKKLTIGNGIKRATIKLTVRKKLTVREKLIRMEKEELEIRKEAVVALIDEIKAAIDQ